MQYFYFEADPNIRLRKQPSSVPPLCDVRLTIFRCLLVSLQVAGAVRYSSIEAGIALFVSVLINICVVAVFASGFVLSLCPSDICRCLLSALSIFEVSAISHSYPFSPASTQSTMQEILALRVQVHLFWIDTAVLLSTSGQSACSLLDKAPRYLCFDYFLLLFINISFYFSTYIDIFNISPPLLHITATH